MTALSGLPAYLNSAFVARLEASVRSHVGVREGAQGWTDAQIVVALVMLNLAGGESVDDLRLLEKDEGLGRALLTAETHGMRRTQRDRWRKERSRTVPSPTAVFRYLNRFHDEAEGGQETVSQGVHTGGQRRADWDAQAAGVLLLQKARGVPAADHLLA